LLLFLSSAACAAGAAPHALSAKSAIFLAIDVVLAALAVAKSATPAPEACHGKLKTAAEEKIVKRVTEWTPESSPPVANIKPADALP
jgi:hypothetical protein